MARTHRFDVVLRIGVAKPKTRQEKEHVHYSVGVMHQQALDRTIMESAVHPLLGIAALSRDTRSEFKAAEFRAANLFDVLLFILGTLAVGNREYDSAIGFFDQLDRRLESRQSNPSAQPRYAVRAAVYRSVMVPMMRGASKWTDNEELNQATSTALGLVPRYGAQFPGLKITIARHLVLLGQYQEALQMCNDPLQEGTDTQVRMFNDLAIGAVRLLTGDYLSAVRPLESFLKSPSLEHVNWVDLADFADTVRAKGNANAIYLQTLYRRIMNGGVAPLEMEEAVSRWFEEAPERTSLRKLLDSARTPQGSRVPQEVAAAPTTKNRFKKRKRKR
jgi:uncharacterized protein HemY